MPNTSMSWKSIWEFKINSNEFSRNRHFGHEFGLIFYESVFLLIHRAPLNQLRLKILYKKNWISVGTLISLTAFLTLSSWESICYSSMLKKLSISSSSSALFCTGWMANFVKDILLFIIYTLLIGNRSWIVTENRGKIIKEFYLISSTYSEERVENI